MKKTPMPFAAFKRHARRARLGEERPSIHEWMEMVARVEAGCVFQHQPILECKRCDPLYALALIQAAVYGETPALVILDRLLDALESREAA